MVLSEVDPSRVKAVAFDLDGVIYIGNRLVPGVSTLLETLKERGIQTFFFTNNSMHPRPGVHQKLAALGVAIPLGCLYTTAHFAGAFLKERGLKTFHGMGTKALRVEVEAYGLIHTEFRSEAILVGLDPEFDYRKLKVAMRVYFSSPGCRIFACNRDSTYPVEDGLNPGCGPAIAALEDATGHGVDEIVGKPSPFMLKKLADDWGLSFGQILVVGDSYASDIAMAKTCGSPSVLFSRESRTDPPLPDVPLVRHLKDILWYLD